MLAGFIIFGSGVMVAGAYIVHGIISGFAPL